MRKDYVDLLYDLACKAEEIKEELYFIAHKNEEPEEDIRDLIDLNDWISLQFVIALSQSDKRFDKDLLIKLEVKLTKIIDHLSLEISGAEIPIDPK